MFTGISHHPAGWDSFSAQRHGQGAYRCVSVSHLFMTTRSLMCKILP
jgi:hypothetical protein